MSLSFQSLLSAEQITTEDIYQLVHLANDYKRDLERVRKMDVLSGYVLGTLFFEPSTRTRFSFESAMYRLNGNVITLEQAESSSLKKGESLADMGRVVSAYADIIVIRHPMPGSVEAFSKFASVPTINAGDGPNQHPTQSLVDLYTIFSEKGRIENISIGFVGDLKYGRTVHSLIKLMTLFGASFTFISHPSLCVPDALRKELLSSGCAIRETESLQDGLSGLDVLYVTRIQRERFESQDAYEGVKNLYRIDRNQVASLSDLIILHPLPRVSEISTEVDGLPQAKYFEQVDYGVYIRMALLKMMIQSRK